MSQCQLFSNHGNVILVLADDPDARLRDVALKVGITERAVQKIVRDLQDEGLLSVTRHGRRNRYRINTRKALRHPLESTRTLGSLLNLMREKPASDIDDAREPDERPRPAVKLARRPVKKIGSGSLGGGGTGPVLDTAGYPDSASVQEPVSDKTAADPGRQKQEIDILQAAESAEPEKPASDQGAGEKKKRSRRSRKKSSSSDEQQGSLF